MLLNTLCAGHSVDCKTIHYYAISDKRSFYLKWAFDLVLQSWSFQYQQNGLVNKPTKKGKLEISLYSISPKISFLFNFTFLKKKEKDKTSPTKFNYLVSF